MCVVFKWLLVCVGCLIIIVLGRCDFFIYCLSIMFMLCELERIGMSVIFGCFVVIFGRLSGSFVFIMIVLVLFLYV